MQPGQLYSGKNCPCRLMDRPQDSGSCCVGSNPAKGTSNKVFSTLTNIDLKPIIQYTHDVVVNLKRRERRTLTGG